MFLRVLYDEYLLKEANERMLERSFNEMVINVKKHPLSNFFVDELELFKESRLVAIVGFNNNTFKNLNLKDLLNRNAYSDFEIKGLIITYSAVHPDFYKVLNDQIDLLPENVSCIVYGGVELTSKENEVEIFVIQ